MSESQETGDVERPDHERALRPNATTHDPPRDPSSLRGPPDQAELDGEARLIPEGNELRLVRGSVAIVAGLLVAFFLMGIKSQLRLGVPIGAFAVGLSTFGVLDLLGTFDDPDPRVVRSVQAAALARPLAVLIAGVTALWAFVSMAVAGSFSDIPVIPPAVTAAVLIPGAFLFTVVGFYRVGDTLGVFRPDPDGTARPLLRRHGFWLVAFMTALYLPALGSHSLSDPWETHYGEVAREILARNDWISLWWAQDGWFWSKPVLDFWMQALAMATFGVRYEPGRMLSAVSEGRVPWPEWAVRLPIFLLTLLAVYLLYKAVASVFGRRAGFLGGVVLVTMPQWFLITHQTMTDMPFVAPMAAAMALFLLGVHAEPDEEVRLYEVTTPFVTLRLSMLHLVLGVVIACTLPQIVYLLTRNVEIRLDPFGFYPHLDTFRSGSAGNCGLPGNEACKTFGAVLRGLHPALQALIWIQALGLVCYMSWGERRRQRLLFMAAWFFAALSMMAKGPAGLGLPVLCALAYVVVSRRYRDLLRMEIGAGMLIIVAVALPWFIAMYARHGQPFTDRLVFHDMFKRAFTHVHDTNEGDDVSFRYYVWQLGYAMFPWSGLAPAALVHWLKRREAGVESYTSAFLGVWFLLAFGLFSAMPTKFHHYILPAIPAAAMLVGIFLDRLLGERGGAAGEEADGPRWSAPYVAGMFGGTLLAVFGLSRVFAARAAMTKVTAVEAMGGMTPSLAFARSAWLGTVLTALGLLAIGLSALILGQARRPAARPSAPDDAESFSARYERALLGAAAAAGAILVFLVGRDLAGNENLPSQIRLMHLFTYNYKRPWPPTLDFTADLWAATFAAAIATATAAVASVRRHAVIALSSFAAVFTLWGVDVYLMKTSPHWGQRETMIAYYEAARSQPGPLVAYQMNWKGENFYAGNRLPAFVSTGKKFQDFILEEKRKGHKTFYFMSEHSRTTALSNELGSPRIFNRLTSVAMNNKFVLIQATFE
jgi:4-amino-4-deoxy-L-arabinose transferase-like glycosyltransferase